MLIIKTKNNLTPPLDAITTNTLNELIETAKCDT